MFYEDQRTSNELHLHPTLSKNIDRIAQQAITHLQLS